MEEIGENYYKIITDIGEPIAAAMLQVHIKIDDKKTSRY